MNTRFSFTGEPALFILNRIPDLVPGVQKIFAVYRSNGMDTLSYTILVKEMDGFIPRDFYPDHASPVIERLRNENAPYSWLLKEELPFDPEHRGKVNLDLFRESDNNVLLIRVNNQFDSLNDLFFLLFDRGLNSFGGVTSREVFATDNKTIIATLVRNAILAMRKVYYSDKDVLATLHENLRSMIEEMENLKKEASRMREKYREGIIRLCQGYLEGLSRQNLRSYAFTESTVEKLSGYSGDLSLLAGVIEKALEYADSMIPEPGQQEIKIYDFHIVFSPGTAVRAENIPVLFGDVPVKYGKTLLLLDKLEKAAESLKSRNKLLTSSNIGHEFPSPVSPPAITDALKKHRAKILFLFSEYPNRWEIIRNEFRPVQNILNIRREPDQRTA